MTTPTERAAQAEPPKAPQPRAIIFEAHGIWDAGDYFDRDQIEDYGRECFAAGRASRAQEAPAPGYEKMRGGKPVSFWRDDALEQSAQIAERYGADPWAARDIRAMKSPLPAAPEQQEKPT